MAGSQWVRVDTNYLSNAKIRRAGRDATLLHLASILYLGDHGRDDGMLPHEALSLLPPLAWQRGPEPAADALVKAGLWIPDDDGGYIVHDYDELNGRDSAAYRDRMRKRRDRMRKREGLSTDVSADGPL